MENMDIQTLAQQLLDAKIGQTPDRCFLKDKTTRNPFGSPQFEPPSRNTTAKKTASKLFGTPSQQNLSAAFKTGCATPIDAEHDEFAVHRSPSPSPQLVVGKLLFEDTGERKLESVPVEERATTRRTVRAKRKLEDNFSGDQTDDNTDIPAHKRCIRLKSAPSTAGEAGTSLAEQDAMLEDNSDTELVPSTSGVFGAKTLTRLGAENSDGCFGSSNTLHRGTPALQQPYSPLGGAGNVQIPVVDAPDCGCPSITVQTMRTLISSNGATLGIPNYIIIDCRYRFEYEGGHIKGAQNLATPDELDAFLNDDTINWADTCIILYCEFSSERAPRAFRHVRQQDRKRHFEMNDLLSLRLPHMYVMQGGYSSFYEIAPDLCSPNRYVSMHDPAYQFELQVMHRRVKEAWARVDPHSKSNPSLCKKGVNRKVLYSR